MSEIKLLTPDELSASRLHRFCMTTVRRKVSVLQINC